MIDRVFVAVDVETTGLEAGKDEIIEVAAVRFRGDTVLETFASLVAPRHSVPLKIQRLTSISAEMLVGQPRFAQIAPDLARFLGSDPIVGHSIGFDLRMLQAHGMRLPQPSYDTLEMAQLLAPQLPAYRLGALTLALGLQHDAAHRALSDAHAARLVFTHLVGRIAALGLDDLAEINRLTAKIDWKLRDLFLEVERARARTAFSTGIPDRPGGGNAIEEVLTPLKPTGDTRPIAVDAVERFFAGNGAMGRIFPGYEQRDQQVQMASAVADVLNQGGALVVEAGTGTGKGMAYLAPAAMFAARRGERVVVSTNTINLQDQLFFKDIPTLQRVLTADSSGTEFSAALLKGRGNYLCLYRYKQLRRDGRLQPEEVSMLLKIQLWLPTTTTGDKAELPLYDREATAWGRVSAAFEQCNGPRCSLFNECHFFIARKRAEAAHIVVVNHALLLADLAAETQVIPPYDHVVVDEAHNFEDVATDQFGFAIDRDGLLKFLDDLYVEGTSQMVGGLLSELPTHLRESTAGEAERERAAQAAELMRPAIARGRESVYACFNLLTAYIAAEAETTAYDARVRITADARKQPHWAQIERAWDGLSVNLNALGEGLGSIEALLTAMDESSMLEYEQLVMRVAGLKRFATDTRIRIGHIIVGGEEALVTWVSHDRNKDTVQLASAPLSVAPLLESNLFAQKSTVVLTSATLSVAGDFGYLCNRLGVPEPEQLMLDSPFDYEKQALIYIPTDVPEPNQPGYQKMLEETLVELVKAVGGRTLVLFTATNALRQTYRAIQEPLEEAGITVLGQGLDGSRRAVLDRFKEFPRTVLLGTTSFWEGVDVVGDALSVLVIARLPFSVPNDPVFAARSEGFRDSFGEYSVPQSILRFKQGFGRLVRSRGDRGVVAVFDRRLISKKYGQLFLDSLPPTLVRTGVAKQLPALAARFLAAGEPRGDAER